MDSFHGNLSGEKGQLESHLLSTQLGELVSPLDHLSQHGRDWCSLSQGDFFITRNKRPRWREWRKEGAGFHNLGTQKGGEIRLSRVCSGV